MCFKFTQAVSSEERGNISKERHYCKRGSVFTSQQNPLVPSEITCAFTTIKYSKNPKLVRPQASKISSTEK